MKRVTQQPVHQADSPPAHALPWEPLEYLKIIATCVVAAVIYGILHDQITARICVEYFTIFHPRIVNSTSPTVLGIFWGIVATWWVGAGLGVLLGVSARAGQRPRFGWRDLWHPLAMLLSTCAAFALVLGFLGYAAYTLRLVQLPEQVDAQLGSTPVDSTWPARFLAVAIAHSASYAVGTIGAVILAVRIWVRRGYLAESVRGRRSDTGERPPRG